MVERMTLRDALAALDDWERDFMELFALEVHERETKQLRTAKIPYARREKLELEAAIGKLTQWLEYAKAKREMDEDTLPLEAKALRIECRSIVARQRNESLRARIENEKLREVFDARRESVMKIRRLFKRALHLGEVLPMEMVVSFNSYEGPRIDPLSHLAELTDLIEASDRVFETDAFRDRQTESYQVMHVEELDRDLLEGIDVVMEAGWALPFSVDAIVDPLWTQATRMVNTTNSIHLVDIHTEPTALVSCFASVPISLTAMPLSHGQVATKFAPVRENAYLAIIRLTNVHTKQRTDPMGSGPPLSRIKMSRRVRIRPIHFDELTRSERAKWVRNVMKGPIDQHAKQNLEHTMQHIENALL